MKTKIDKQKDHAFGKDVYLLGKDKEGIKYWLESPSWDCGWYWGFGYVETYQQNWLPSKAKDISSHSHVKDGLMGHQEYYDTEKQCFRKGEYVSNIYDAKNLHSTTFTEKEGWELSELFNQFYFLSEAAANFGRGKCHIANTKINTWKDDKKANEINTKIIPEVTARIIEILTPE